MANGDAFEDAVRLARETATLDVGCHLALVQGPSLLNARPLPETPLQLVAALVRGQIDIYSELRAQIEKILSAGIRPTHLDTHKHTHIVPQVFRTVVRLAAEFGILYVRRPAYALANSYYRRVASAHNIRMTDHFLGFRLTGSLGEESFARAILSLREGTTEFMCHPGSLGPELKRARTRLKESRVRELEALTSPRIRQLMAAESIHLEAFGTSSSDPAGR